MNEAALGYIESRCRHHRLHVISALASVSGYPAQNHWAMVPQVLPLLALGTGNKHAQPAKQDVNDCREAAALCAF